MTAASWGRLRRLWQAVDARHEHILDGIGNADVAEFLGQHIPLTFTPNSASLAQGLDHLLDKERVALGLLDDQV